MAIFYIDDMHLGIWAHSRLHGVYQDREAGLGKHTLIFHEIYFLIIVPHFIFIIHIN